MAGGGAGGACHQLGRPTHLGVHATGCGGVHDGPRLLHKHEAGLGALGVGIVVEVVPARWARHGCTRGLRKGGTGVDSVKGAVANKVRDPGAQEPAATRKDSLRRATLPFPMIPCAQVAWGRREEWGGKEGAGRDFGTTPHPRTCFDASKRHCRDNREQHRQLAVTVFKHHASRRYGFFHCRLVHRGWGRHGGRGGGCGEDTRVLGAVNVSNMQCTRLPDRRPPRVQLRRHCLGTPTILATINAS